MAIILASGCSQQPEEPQTEASIERNLVLGDAAAANQQFLEAENELQAAIGSCLRGVGFEYWEIDQQTEATIAGEFESLYASIVSYPADETVAAERGFGIAEFIAETGEAGFWEPVERASAIAQNTEYYESLTEPERSAYVKERDRCETAALDSVRTSVKIMDEVFELQVEIDERLEANQEYGDLVSEWRFCMQSQGLMDSDQGEVLTPERFVRLVFEDALASVEQDDSGAALAPSIDQIRLDEIAIAVPTLACGSSDTFFEQVESLRLEISENVLTEHGY